MTPLNCIADCAFVAPGTAFPLVHPSEQEWITEGMSLGISGLLCSMFFLRVELDIRIDPFHRLGVACVFAGALFSARPRSLVASSLVHETTEAKCQNCGCN